MGLKREEKHENPDFIEDYGNIKQENNQGEGVIKRISKLSDTFVQDDENYDPYLHRKVTHPTTNFDTLVHLLKGCLGTGILAMPKAFSNAGYALGFVGTILIGIICTYCIHMLIKCEYELCKRKKVPSLTYQGIVEAAYNEGPRPMKKVAPYSKHVVNAFLLIFQLGVCCVYVLFIGLNIQAVANEYIKEIAIEFFILMFVLPLILINWIRNLKMLAPLATFANTITATSFGIILYYIIDAGITFEQREPVSKFENFPLFFGTVLFSIEAVGMIIPLENEMKSPKSLGGAFGVLNVAMTIILLLYAVIGLLGYLTFGPIPQSTVTLDLPNKAIPAQVCRACLALAIFVTYTIQYYVAIDIAWNQYLAARFQNNSKAWVFEYMLRTFLVLLTVALAVAVPALDLFISLFGAFSLSAVGIVIPATIECCTFWYQKKGWRFNLMIIKNLILILFGTAGFISGTYTSLKDIIEKFS